MNDIKDFQDFLSENNHSAGSNFEKVACEFIKEYSSVGDLAYLIKHLSEIYVDKLYYIAGKLDELQDTFHNIANDASSTKDVKELSAKMEDEMFLLNSSYSE